MSGVIAELRYTRDAVEPHGAGWQCIPLPPDDDGGWVIFDTSKDYHTGWIRSLDLDQKSELPSLPTLWREPMSANPLVPGQGRPLPPSELSDPEREIWIATVEARPLNFFDAATWPLLEAYCEHVVLMRQLAAELRVRSTPRRRSEFRKAAAAMASLATKLRLTKLGLRKHQRSDAEDIAATPMRRLWLREVPPRDAS